jgi:hypothetical protein
MNEGNERARVPIAPRPGFAGRVRRSLFGIKPRETSFEYRGFLLPLPPVRERLERVVGAFVDGYHAAITWGTAEALPRALASIEPELLGFAVEGSAMGLGILDLVTPWGRWKFNRLVALLEGYGADHLYLALCGAGWALARLRRPVEPLLARLHAEPMRWLVVDGYGFHEGFFEPKRTIEEHAWPKHVTGYARRAFDHGLGRSLWFICGATPERLQSTIAGFAEERHADLWSGVGLACAYAGGVDESVLRQAQRMAGPHRFAMAQGAAYAAKARERAHNPAPQTELACRTLSGRSAAEASGLVDEVGSNLPPDTGESPVYEVWRQRIQEHLARGERA